jgi:hypothetical protein
MAHVTWDAGAGKEHPADTRTRKGRGDRDPITQAIARRPRVAMPHGPCGVHCTMALWARDCCDSSAVWRLVLWVMAISALREDVEDHTPQFISPPAVVSIPRGVQGSLGSEGKGSEAEGWEGRLAGRESSAVHGQVDERLGPTAPSGCGCAVHDR